MKQFPNDPRQMSNEEGEEIYANLRQQVIDFQPDEIVAMARSGFSYAGWLAQELKLPLGAYWPNRQELVTDPSSRKIVFIDDNTVNGETYLQLKAFMDNKYPETYYPKMIWKFGVFFADWYTPQPILDEIIVGRKLSYFALEPMWGSRKTSQGYGVRYRDE